MGRPQLGQGGRVVGSPLRRINSLVCNVYTGIPLSPLFKRAKQIQTPV
jgi:hypothetical protein